MWLASRGGGIGSYWGGVRSIGEKVKQNLGELFIRDEAKIPSINSKLINFEKNLTKKGKKKSPFFLFFFQKMIKKNRQNFKKIEKFLFSFKIFMYLEFLHF